VSEVFCDPAEASGCQAEQSSLLGNWQKC